jgi:hypothetical protein
LPPCIRHLPFAIAGCLHGFPVRLLYAPHLGTLINGLLARDCFSLFIFAPTPLGYIANNGLTAFMDVNMLHGHPLLASPPVFVQGFQLLVVKPHQLRVSV